MLESSAFSILGALSGCIGCMVCVESIAKEAPSSMNLMTFLSFLFISVEGLVMTSRFFTQKNKIPLRGYLPVVVVFFLSNLTNNQALNYSVPVPLHIIFRSGSLLTSLILNRIILKRAYSTKKYLSVLMITVGIVMCTLATANLHQENRSTTESSHSAYSDLMFGITLLSIALVLSSLLAICQETMYKTYGKHPREAMFYIHAVSLPFFAFFGNDIVRSIVGLSSAEPFHLNGWYIFGRIPFVWMKLLGSTVMQWMCILFVYRLGSQLDSLSVTLVVTLRKFLSLLISIFWFKNMFTTVHWIGTALVFIGTLSFSDVLSFPSLKKGVRNKQAINGHGNQKKLS